MRAVDLFCGAGGFSVGATSAGAEIVWAANHWGPAVETHQRNHPGVPHCTQDLRQADWSELPPFDTLLGSPACQGHSSAGRPGRAHSTRARMKHEDDRSTAFAIIDCVDVCEPQDIIIENVPEFRSWRLYPEWKAMLRRVGYELEEHILNAADFGVPQERKRLFILGRLGGPPPSVEPPDVVVKPVSAILDEDGRWAPVASKPEKVQARVAKGREKWGRTFLTQHTTNHPGRPLDRPIGTITTASGHWNLVDGDNIRPLSTAELARAHGFPEWYTFDDRSSVATRLIGNAVCPPVAEHLVKRIKETR